MAWTSISSRPADGSYWTAEIALSDCAGFKAVIDELEFQLEVMEADNA